MDNYIPNILLIPYKTINIRLFQDLFYEGNKAIIHFKINLIMRMFD